MLTSKLNFKTAGGSVMDLHLKALGLVELGNEVTVITAFSAANIINDPLPYKVIEEHVTSPGLLGIQYNAYHILKKYQAIADVIYIDGQIFVYAGGIYRLLGGNVPVAAFFNTRLNCMADTSGTGNNGNASVLKKIKKQIRFDLEHTLGVFFANHIDWMIFNTPHVQEIYRNFGYRTTRSVVIEDFVDMRGTIEKYDITETTVSRRQQNLEKIQLFSTGRMIKEKGFDIIVRAFAVLENKDKYHVILSGGGPDKERVENLVKELGLEKYFSFPGWVDKDVLTGYFQSAQIFIFPKWWIEYGSALLTEALAFGLPCIIPAGGALEWLTEGNVMTFKNDDSNDLASCIAKLGSDEKLRIKLSLDSLRRADTLDCRILSKKLQTALKNIYADNACV